MKQLTATVDLSFQHLTLCLAATPDGWVVDPLAAPSRGLVEFKIHAAART